MRNERRWQVSLVCIVLLALLAPSVMALNVCGQDQMIFDESEPVDIACETGRLSLWNSTVNLLPDAHISEAIAGATAGILESFGGSTVNITGGTVDTYLNLVAGDVVTITGSELALGGQSLEGVTQIVGPVGTPYPLNPEFLTGVDENGGSISIPCVFEGDVVLNVVWVGGPSIIDVDIDIKPDSVENTVNLGSMGVIPVGILSTDEFDATQVDPWTVELAGSGVAVRGRGSKLLSSAKDLNGDGLLDLEVKVETENLEPGQFQDGAAILTGQTYDGLDIQGSDIITIVPVE